MHFDPYYLLFNLLATLLAVALYLVNIRVWTLSRRIVVRLVGGFFLVTILSLLVAFSINFLTHPAFYHYPPDELVHLTFSYLYAMVTFLVLARLLLPRFGVSPVQIENTVPSLILFLAFSRIGCQVAGCCYGRQVGPWTVPTALVECLLAFGLFPLFQFVIKRDRVVLFLIVYCSFRFLLDFLKVHYSLRLGPLHPPQVVALAVVAVASWLLLLDKDVLSLVIKVDKEREQ